MAARKAAGPFGAARFRRWNVVEAAGALPRLMLAGGGAR
jgi:hypothetical protein